MIAIIESGTTKTSWLFVDKEDKTYEFKTLGINPYYQSANDIKTNITESLLPNLNFTEPIDKIYFYGPGCELPAQKLVVKQGISEAFPKSVIEVNHDLLAAARALCGDKWGIACIAGTGANSCLYDGNDVVVNIHSLGLFLGDEGSGGYNGKLLVADYIRNAMPVHIRQMFELKYTDRTPEIMEAVYIKQFPSRYLASFMPFIVENLQEEYIHDLVFKSFEAQFDNTICRYENYQDHEIGFVGSTAHFLKDILMEVAAKKKANITKIVRAPLNSLVEYHKSKGWM